MVILTFEKGGVRPAIPFRLRDDSRIRNYIGEEGVLKRAE
jgi:hypothetical protein